MQTHTASKSFEPMQRGGLFRLIGLGVMTAAAVLLAQRAGAQFQSDNFNDGNDQGWTRYNPFAGVGANIATWTFPNGGYRIQTIAPSPDPANLGPGRAGSVRSEIYTNFYISVDIVNWNENVPQAGGILARIRNAGLGTTTGYAFTWDRGNPTNATDGDVDISSITGEAPDGVTLTGSDRLHLNPGTSYRFVFIGKGPNLEGRVYQLPNTNTPVVQVTGFDQTYESGAGGLVIYDNSDGADQTCDVTFDNFYAIDSEPPTLQLVDLGFNEWAVGWPADATSWKLQSTGAIGSAWTDVDPNLIVLQNDQFQLPLPAPLSTGTTTFYRLIHR